LIEIQSNLLWFFLCSTLLGFLFIPFRWPGLTRGRSHFCRSPIELDHPRVFCMNQTKRALQPSRNASKDETLFEKQTGELFLKVIRAFSKL
jgi:hypothetical protein